MNNQLIDKKILSNIVIDVLQMKNTFNTYIINFGVQIQSYREVASDWIIISNLLLANKILLDLYSKSKIIHWSGVLTNYNCRIALRSPHQLNLVTNPFISSFRHKKEPITWAQGFNGTLPRRLRFVGHQNSAFQPLET